MECKTHNRDLYGQLMSAILYARYANNTLKSRYYVLEFGLGFVSQNSTDVTKHNIKTVR